MTKNLPAKTNSSSLLPVAVTDLGTDGQAAFIEFFTAQIHNANTRAAYLRAVRRFCSWLADAGLQLEGLSPAHVAAYIEPMDKPVDQGGHGLAAATVKQHLAAIRMLCSFLVVRQIISRNPALEVRGPKLIVRVGKTPVLTGEEARELFASIDLSKPIGLRDRALLGLMVYSFARIGAALEMDVCDYFQVGRKMMLQLHEKGGKEHQMPAHHTLIEYMEAYLQELGVDPGETLPTLASKGSSPLFRTINRRRTGFTDNRLDRREAWAMVKRRTKAAGLGDRFCNHTFRGTGITAYLANDGDLQKAQQMAAHASMQTTKLYDRTDQEATLDEVEKIRL